MLKGQLTAEMLKSLNLKATSSKISSKKAGPAGSAQLGIDRRLTRCRRPLAKVPEFQIAGSFNKDRYLQLLRQPFQPAEFEEEQREQDNATAALQDRSRLGANYRRRGA